jgi:hypothetical protein
VTGEEVSKSLKRAATLLNYPATPGIPIARINTHLLKSGGANALALFRYLDTQLQIMGQWKGMTFKEYIREELVCYSVAMSTNMKCTFKFVLVSRNAYNNVISKCIKADYNIKCAAVA